MRKELIEKMKEEYMLFPFSNGWWVVKKTNYKEKIRKATPKDFNILKKTI